MKENDQNQLDPDVRFLLANERTLLSWVRTSLTIQAVGLALTQIHSSSNNRIVGILILLTGAALALVGYSRFKAADRAIRHNHLPAAGHGPKLQVAGVVMVAVVLIGVEFISH